MEVLLVIAALCSFGSLLTLLWILGTLVAYSLKKS